ncbi:uncharacterized protein LOC108141030 [Drosophila elegans]|uniref:uncharacterized protein LOC108141030 n=1 Tax=Drosophila elegans TaxID=30023 RepID=UPI0007E5DD72|nr:uncharacterized protein LOC108141030 [Drosophila elegans]
MFQLNWFSAMLSKLVTCLFCIAVLIFISDLNDAVVFKFTNFVCKSHNQSWFVFHYCRLKAISRDRVLLNVNGTVLYPAYDIQVHAKIFKKASGFKPWLLDANIDGCRYMRKNYNPFLGIVFSLFQDFSNINHTCPYVGLQTVKDFYLRPDRLKLPFPSGEYMLSLQWFFDKKPQFDTNVTFTYMEDLLKRN